VDDVLGFKGKKVVVTGAASGMGAATADALVQVGAEVIALDVKPTDVAVADYVAVDLRDKASIDEAVAKIGSSVASVFSVAGLPGPPFADLDTVLRFTLRDAPEGTRLVMEHVGLEGWKLVLVSFVMGQGWKKILRTRLPAVLDALA
jgi:NAD(P)-dependent dehydrogenase (short-subunit alcohol dehydrogenase family)